MTTNVLVDDMLKNARALLDGTVVVPRCQAARLSSFLARQALEELVAELCRAKGHWLDSRVPMRSQLIVIRVLYNRETAALAEVAWTGLSSACHHRAYELTPTTAEVQHYLGLVSKLSESLP